MLCMVVRTGLRSTMGTMLRQVINPLHATRLYKDPFLLVTSASFRFVALQTILPYSLYLFEHSATVTICCMLMMHCKRSRHTFLQ